MVDEVIGNTYKDIVLTSFGAVLKETILFEEILKEYMYNLNRSFSPRFSKKSGLPAPLLSHR